MLTFASNAMAMIALLPVTALLLIYGLLQPWWRSKFGLAMILTLFALWQMTLRAIVVIMFGEEYSGRPIVLLLGRTELTVGATIAAVGLGRQLVRSYRAGRGAEKPPRSATGHSRAPEPADEV